MIDILGPWPGAFAAWFCVRRSSARANRSGKGQFVQFTVRRDLQDSQIAGRIVLFSKRCDRRAGPLRREFVGLELGLEVWDLFPLAADLLACYLIAWTRQLSLLRRLCRVFGEKLACKLFFLWMLLAS